MAPDLVGERVAALPGWETGPTGVVIGQVGQSLLVRWQWGQSWVFDDQVKVL